MAEPATVDPARMAVAVEAAALRAGIRERWEPRARAAADAAMAEFLAMQDRWARLDDLAADLQRAGRDHALTPDDLKRLIAASSETLSARAM